MESDKYNFSLENNPDNGLKDLLGKYLIHWKWFILSIAIALVGARYYYKAQTPLYEVSSTILIKDDRKGDLSELSAFEDLGLLKKSNNIENEVELLKSRALMTRVVQELRLHIRYFLVEKHLESELYRKSPLEMDFPKDTSIESHYLSFYLTVESDNSFIIKSENGEEKGNYKFGQVITFDGATFIVSKTAAYTDWYVGHAFHITVEPIIDVADQYRNNIQVFAVNKSSGVLMLTLKDPVIEKASNIIDNLIRQHNADAISDKNQVSKNTADFINDRIQFISNELSSVEGEAEEFKTRHKLTDVESEAKLFLETGKLSEMSLLEINTQIRLAEFMNEYIQKHSGEGDLLPSNLGLSDASLSSEISDYNKLVLERNRILKNSSNKNPVVENINNQLQGISRSIRESLDNYQEALKIKLSELNRNDREISAKIGSVPKYEREYRIIQRQQQIKEALYLYLLQKREETNIALAVTVANIKVIDSAFSNNDVVSPNKKRIYLLAFLIGLFIPVITLLIIDLLDTKVHSKKDTDFIKLPYLGDIPLSSSKAKLVLFEKDTSSIAEGFRLLRTNVDFITNKGHGQNRTIFVTSTIGKEGKSFIALNLASSFALSGKKTLLIGTDLRAPKLLAYLNLGEKKGITDFIMDRNLKLEEIIYDLAEVQGLSILPSGPIPPNPAELLMNPRMREIFESVKAAYDYVIVDTAPVGLVTDTLLISEFADCTVFVTRANYLDKRMLRVAETLYREKRLPNMAAVINGTDIRKGYGYGYGYGNDKPKKWWQKLFSINKS